VTSPVTGGPLILDGCVGCVICVDLCPGDVLAMDPERTIAVVAYVDECWYCGVCRIECPVDAVRFQLPMAMVRV
jgi:NAD-dependent dihydropyrimidine dehydrogenase PreA subunit